MLILLHVYTRGGTNDLEIVNLYGIWNTIDISCTLPLRVTLNFSFNCLTGKHFWHHVASCSVESSWL